MMVSRPRIAHEYTNQHAPIRVFVQHSWTALPKHQYHRLLPKQANLKLCLQPHPWQTHPIGQAGEQDDALTGTQHAAYFGAEVTIESKAGKPKNFSGLVSRRVLQIIIKDW